MGVHVGSSGTAKANLQGSFKIVFYDVFGEKYVTKTINAKGATAADVKLALQALPNGVIAKNNQDVTAEQPNAVTVSAQTSSNAPGVDQAGGVGGGQEGAGSGLGTMKNHGSEFTITFKTNPGILKSIEIDTRAVNNPGRPDYWVANARQGQFASRYTKNLGRIQVLQYGSKHLYTNNDLTTAANGGVAQHTLVKVGGQEFRVHEAKTNKLILDEPYLGASIQPVTVDTGVTAKTGAGTFLKAASTDTAPRSDRIQVVGTVSAAIASSLGVGAAIYINDCAMTVNAYANALGSDTVATAADQTIIAGTYAAGSPRNVGVEAATDGGNDCALSFLSTGTQPIYRRSDDTANQNLYKTTGDQAAATASGMGVSFQRGSATGDITTSNEDTGVLNAIDLIAEVTTAGSETTTVTELQATGSVAANDKFYFHTHGPFAVDDVSTTKELVFNGVDAQQTIIGLFGAPTTAAHIHMTTSAGASDGALDATKALLIGGRRYRVKSKSGTSVTLSETFAGGQLRQVCAACVTAQGTTASAAGSFDLSINKAISGIPAGAL